MNDPKHDAAWHGTPRCGHDGCRFLVTHTDLGWRHVDTHGVETDHDAEPMTAQPKPTTAEVLAGILWRVERPERMDGLPDSGYIRERYADKARRVADMLAAAGLLTVSAPEAIRPGELIWVYEDGPYGPNNFRVVSRMKTDAGEPVALYRIADVEGHKDAN